MNIVIPVALLVDCSLLHYATVLAANCVRRLVVSIWHTDSQAERTENIDYYIDYYLDY